MSDDDMTTTEAAAMLRQDIRIVQRLCHAGALDCRKVRAKWMISRVSVLAYIAREANRLRKPS